MKVARCGINSKKFKNCNYKKKKVKSKKKIDDYEFYSALLLIFSNAFSKIKNKPTPIPLPKNDDNTNTTTNSHTTTNTLPTKTTTIPSTTSTSTTSTPKPTKPDFNLPKRPKNLPEPETSNTTTSTTMTIPSTTSSSPTTTFTKTTSKPSEPRSETNVSCPICKINLKQTEIEKHLKEHIKNPLSKDFIRDRLKIKKSAIEFDNIFYKLTDFQIRELIETLQKYIEKYGEQFIDFIPDEMKQEIYYNFDKIMLGVVGLIIKFSNLSFFFYKFY